MEMKEIVPDKFLRPKGTAGVVNELKLLSYKMLKEMKPEEHEIFNNNDVTFQFYHTLYDKILHNELISMTVKGEVVSGKSTVAMAVKKYINDVIKKLGKNKKISEYNTVCSDMVEFNRKIMNTDKNVCYVIDEWSELNSTGENATSEQALFNHYSDVCAQLFVHRVMCSPSNSYSYDRSATINLEVMAKDEENKYTMCKLKMSNVVDGESVLLGKMWVYVGDVLEEDWYKSYRKKKFRRMDLLNKHGLRDVREAEHSDIALSVFEELRDIITPKKKLSPEMITLEISNELQKRKLVYSIIGKSSVKETVSALTGIFQEIMKYEKQLEKPKQEDEVKSTKKILEKMKKQYKKVHDNCKMKRKILKDYLAIGEKQNE